MNNPNQSPVSTNPSGPRQSSDQVILMIGSGLFILFFIVRAILGAVVSRNANVKPEPAGYTFFSMGNNYYEQGEYAKAIEQFNLSINMSPDFGEAYNNRGLVYFDLGNYDQAWADFDKAVQLTPLSATPYNNRGATYLAKGEIDPGLVDLNKAIEMDQHFAKAYFNRGLANMDQGKTDEAIADFTKAIENTPEWIVTMFNRIPASMATSEAGPLPGITSYIDIVQKYVDLPLVYSQRGYAYIVKTEYDLAVADLQKALELGPDEETRAKIESMQTLVLMVQTEDWNTEITGEFNNLIPTLSPDWMQTQETPEPVPTEAATSYEPRGGAVVDLVIDPKSPANVYAVVLGGGIYKSTDTGENWKPANDGIPLDVSSLAIDPVTPKFLYASLKSSYASVFMSINGGENWSNIFYDPAIEPVTTLVIDPVTPTTLYAGIENGGGILKSTDGGVSWLPINNGLEDLRVLAIVIDSQSPANLYARTLDGRTFKSTDGGESWTVSLNILPEGQNRFLIIDPRSPSTLYTGCPYGFYKSTDGGDNWMPLTNGLLGYEQITALVLHPIAFATLYAGAWNSKTNSGFIMMSWTSGERWEGTVSNLPNTRVNVLAVDPMQTYTLYMGTQDSILKSVDNGLTWYKTNFSLIPLHIRSLAASPNGILYAGTDSKSMHSAGSIFTSQDGGWSWSIWDASLQDRDVWALAFDPLSPNIVYAGTGGDGLIKSTDYGMSWVDINNYFTANQFIYSLVVDPANPSTIYAGGDTVYKSIDGGQNWESVGTGLPTSGQALAIKPQGPATLPEGPSILYAGGGNGLFTSDNGGASWVEIDADIRGTHSPGIFSIAIDPVTPTTLYAGTWDGWTPSGGSLFKSTDGGQSWKEINTGLPNAIVYSIAIDPITPGNVYVGTALGAFKSSDGGDSWRAIDASLSETIITAVVLDPFMSSTLYVGSYDFGVLVYRQVDEE